MIIEPFNAPFCLLIVAALLPLMALVEEPVLESPAWGTDAVFWPGVVAHDRSLSDIGTPLLLQRLIELSRASSHRRPGVGRPVATALITSQLALNVALSIGGRAEKLSTTLSICRRSEKFLLYHGAAEMGGAPHCNAIDHGGGGGVGVHHIAMLLIYA